MTRAMEHCDDKEGGVGDERREVWGRRVGEEGREGRAWGGEGCEM